MWKIICFAFFSIGVRGDFNILLLHTNDMHAHFQQANPQSSDMLVPQDLDLDVCGDNSTSCYGGFARIKNVVDLKRQEAEAAGRSTIFLNAGDSYEKTPYYTLFRWKVVADFIDRLGIDVMSLGNHEFDDGVAGLAPYIANISVPTVCANCDFSQEPSLIIPNLTPSYVLTVNGTKIGVIGYLFPGCSVMTDIGKVQLLDEVTSIRAEAQRLLQQNVSILIALGHSGYKKDMQIAQEVEEIDLVVGAHTHTFLYNGTSPSREPVEGPYPTVITQTSGKQVPVVTAYWATKYLGYLELNFDDVGNLLTFSGQPILLSANYSQDPAILAVLDTYKAELKTEYLKIVGLTSVRLENDNYACRLGECNIGNLITDALVDYVKDNYNSTSGWPIASIGLQDALYMGTSVENGSITMKDYMNLVLPWDKRVSLITVTGQQLVDGLEASVSQYEDTLDGSVTVFLQVSGLMVEYDVNQTAGSRVVNVTVLCANCTVPAYEPLVLDQRYDVVLPQYLTEGERGFTSFNVTNNTVLDKGYWTIVKQYIEKNSPIHPATEGRIVIRTSSTPSSVSVASASSALLLSTSILFIYSNYV